MHRRQMLAAAAGAAASTPLPFELTAEEAAAYQDALETHDVNSFDQEQVWLWERWFGVPHYDSGFPGIGMAPQEFMAYKARLTAVVALAPDILSEDVGPLCAMDEAVMVFANAFWFAGLHTGMAMEHLRLASLHRALREPELMLK